MLTISVLSIILTAPLGAIGILGAGPRLLNKSTAESVLETDLGAVELNNAAIDNGSV